MRTRTFLLLAPVLVPLLAGSPAARSCGESMFRVGFGMEIPAGSVQQSVNVVIFKASDTSPDVFFDDRKVAARLGKAGHHVAVAETPSAVSADVDVVLVRADEIEKARSELGAQVAKAVFLPVVEGFASGARDSELSLAANSPLREILGVLQRAVQSIPS